MPGTRSLSFRTAHMAVALTMCLVSGQSFAHELVLHVVDEENTPLPLVQIGRYMDWSYPDLPTYYLGSMSDIPPATDDDGRVVLKINEVFYEGEESPETLKLFLHHFTTGNAGTLEVNKSDFAGEKTVVLKAPIEVSGKVTVDEGELTWASLGILQGERLVGVAGVSKDFTFNLQLPPGDFAIRAYGGGKDGPQLEVIESVSLEHGQPISMNLAMTTPEMTEPDSQASDFLASQKNLVGEVAPEFQSIRGWMNSEPLTMNSLRGKPVLLDFWGYWCGPCVYSMPRLMAIHDAFKEHGLVVIGIHEAASLESIDELPAMVKNSKETVWGNRDIPFPLALDGGTAASGDTTQAYGVVGFPTSYLIDREGKVHSTFHPSSPDAWQEICELVGVDIPEETLKAAPAKPSSIAEPMPTAPAAQEWERAAGTMYALQEGWPVRYIYPPFISARNEMIKEKYPDLDMEANGAPDMIILRHGSETTDNFPVAAYGYLPNLPLRSVLHLVIGIEPWAIAGDEGLLEIDMMGDWVVDRSVDQEELVTQFAEYARDMLGLDIEIDAEKVEDQVINLICSASMSESQHGKLAQRIYNAVKLPVKVTPSGAGTSAAQLKLPPPSEDISAYVAALNAIDGLEATLATEPLQRWVVSAP